MPSILSLLLPVALGVAGALASGFSRRAAWLGAIAFGLGAAGVRVALRLPLAGTADPLWVGSLPPASLRIDAALEILGATLAAAAGLLAWRNPGGIAPRLGSGLAACSAAGMTLALFPLARTAGWPGALAATVAIAGGAALAGSACLAFARALARQGRAERDVRHAIRGRSGWIAALAVGGALAIAGPHVHLVFGGAVLAAIAAQALSRGEGSRALPVLPVLAAGALGFAGYYLQVIAGSTGLSTDALSEAPLSTAAQALLLPAIAAAALGFMAPWPLHRVVPGPWLAPIGAALLLRIGAEGLPAGIEGWRTVAVPLGVLGTWGAAMAGRPDLLAAAGAWMAAFAHESGGAAGAMLLSIVPLLRPPTAPGAEGSRRRGAGFIVSVALGSLGAVLAADGLFRAEVVYATAATAAVAFSAVYISRAHT
ncbi:MAG TPA: hypothetical protein VF037_00470 [Gemmatimonadales bacterium]